MGIGNTVVELLSAEISRSVWRYRSCNAMGCSRMMVASSLCQFAGRLIFSLCIDNFSTSLSLCLGLFGHGSLHFLGKIDMLNLDSGHLDAPWVRLGIQNLLKLSVYLLPLRKQLVQLSLSAHTAKGGLGKLGRGKFSTSIIAFTGSMTLK
jgi:hypothetical protein